MTMEQIREGSRIHLNQLERTEAELNDMHAVAADAIAERDALKKRLGEPDAMIWIQPDPTHWVLQDFTKE